MVQWVRIAAAALALATVAAPMAAPAAATEATGRKAGFALAPGSAKIVLMRPNIRVGAQSAGGLFEPNADWTAQARDHLGRAIRSAQATLGNQVVDYVEPTGPDAALAAEYQALFATVADSVIEFEFFPGNRLPIKKRADSFEWTLGPEIGGLPGLQGADFALFVFTEDQYGSAGRKALQIFGALAGVGITSGVHKGYAGLVDLKTGELVWLNADVEMGGDVREADGAAKRAQQLFEGFPGRAIATPYAQK